MPMKEPFQISPYSEANKAIQLLLLLNNNNAT